MDQQQQRQQQQRQEKLASFLAGISSGSLASVVCAPLDLVRTRLQVQGSMLSELKEEMGFSRMFRDIIRNDGLVGCFRGLTPTLACVPIFWGIYFPIYEFSKPHFIKLYYGENIHNVTDNHASSPLVSLSSAIFAGAIADVLVNPMFLVRTRMQTESLHYFVEHKEMPQLTMRQTIASLYNEGGGNLLIFWRGLTASMLGLSHVGIQFPTYEYFKAVARRRNDSNEESAADLLVASGLSKLCACAATYPHEVVRSRVMDLRGENAVSMTDTVKSIVKEEGWMGLYRGLHISLIRVVPNCCLTFISYELTLRWIRENILQKPGF